MYPDKTFSVKYRYSNSEHFWQDRFTVAEYHTWFSVMEAFLAECITITKNNRFEI